MILNGFIYENEKKFGFSLYDFSLKLFSDISDDISEFSREHNFKKDYILKGTIFKGNFIPQDILLLIDYSMGASCFVKSYIVSDLSEIKNFDSIVIYSDLLDDIFRYRHILLDRFKKEKDKTFSLNESKEESYNFICNSKQHDFNFYVGNKFERGICSLFKLCGKYEITNVDNIIDATHIITSLYKYMVFLSQHSNVGIDMMYLHSNNNRVASFYLKEFSSNYTNQIAEYQINKNILTFSSKILNNICLDLGAELNNSIPIKHIKNFNNHFSPIRFIEQVYSFEYLFNRVYPKSISNLTEKAELKSKLKFAMTHNKDYIDIKEESILTFANEIKELRRHIMHGHIYVEEINDKQKRYLILMDDLLKFMSFRLIGLSELEIKDCIRQLTDI